MLEILWQHFRRESLLVEYLKGGSVSRPAQYMIVLSLLEYLPSLLDKARYGIFSHSSIEYYDKKRDYN
jgi:hypothetical protein